MILLILPPRQKFEDVFVVTFILRFQSLALACLERAESLVIGAPARPRCEGQQAACVR